MSHFDALSMEEEAVFDVVVVGAGIAGLYAATLLRQHFDASPATAHRTVTILEASAKYGGRMCPEIGLTPHALEMGAEWIHGNGSLLYRTIAKMDRSLIREYKGFKEAISLDGRVHLYPAQSDKAIEAADRYQERLYKYKGPDITVAEHLASLGIVEGDRDWHLYENWIGVEYGTSIKRMGMKSVALAEDLWTSGDSNYLLRAPYLDTVIKAFHMESTLPLVQCNKAVTGVDYSQQHVQLTCSDGSTWRAGKVVIAVPLTILRTLSFSPPLPSNLQQSLSTLGMGAGMKIHLFFDQRFWGEDVVEVTLQGHGSSGWDPGYFKWGNKGDRLAGPHVLSFLISGEHAEALTDLPDDAKVRCLLDELDALYNGTASIAFSSHSVKDWTKEPFVQGAYSFPGPGSYVNRGNHARKAFLQCLDDKVVFAGEVAAQTHPSTVHGAMESAEAAVASLKSRMS